MARISNLLLALANLSQASDRIGSVDFYGYASETEAIIAATEQWSRMG